MQYFQTIFLEEADKFIADLDAKIAKKVFYNVDLAQQANDPKLFKKLQNTFVNFAQSIVGFRFGYLHFGTNPTVLETLVIAVLGFIKKGGKVPKNEIERAIRLRMKYFENK
jgi:phage-related protein